MAALQTREPLFESRAAPLQAVLLALLGLAAGFGGARPAIAAENLG